MDRAEILSEMGIDTWVRTGKQDAAHATKLGGHSTLQDPLSSKPLQDSKTERNETDSGKSDQEQLEAVTELGTAEAGAVAELSSESEMPGSAEELRAAVVACQQCTLCDTRTLAVPGAGNPSAQWMFVGTAPGVEEDRQGEPFVGRAGQLLDNILRALGLARQDVYISSVLKCHPPGNRELKSKEIDNCRPYLSREIQMVKPDVIIALGDIATRELLQNDMPSRKLRGKVHRLSNGDIPCVVTFHPSVVLRDPSHKKDVWDDLMLAKTIFEKDSTLKRSI